MLVRQREEVQALPRRLSEPISPSVAKDITRLVAFGLLGGAALAIYASFRIWQQGQVDQRRPADAIVVLGAAHYEETPSAVFAARLDHAIDLYREGLAPYLVTTGGRAPGDRLSEAEAARTYALKHGVPASAILMEDEGRDTLASLRNVASVLGERDLHSAVFVSDRLHMLRVILMARDLGMTPYGSPTTTSPTDSSSPEYWLGSLAHELGGLVVYLFLGRGG